MCKSLLKKSLVLVAALAASFSAFAQVAVEEITDAAGLAAISNDLAGHYVLAADITLSGEWTPIGNSGAPFTGTFDGNGHSIKGLTITGDNNGVGLFGQVNGEVKDVRILGANVRGNEHVGIVAGRLLGGGVIDGVFTSGVVSGRDHEGAIVGHIEEAGFVSNCMSTAYVDGRQYQGGGIAGWSKGYNTVENNLFLGSVKVNLWGGCGGIVGFYEPGTLSVLGNVCIAASLTGQYGELPVSGANRYTHGIVGGPLNDESYLDAGDNLLSEETKIFLTDGTELMHADMDEAHNGIDTSVANLKKAATYTNIGFGSAWSLADGRFPVLAGMTVPFDGDYVVTSDIPTEAYVGNTFDTEALSAMGKTVTITSDNTSAVAVSGTVLSFNGAGTATITFATAADGYVNAYTKTVTISVQDMNTDIATPADLEKIRKNPSADFQLTADIDMAGVEFEPLPDFTGTLEGNGHVIRNLKYDNREQAQVALFSTTHSAVIRNLGIEGAYFVGNENVGGLVGRIYGGLISGCYVANSYIEGRDHVGAIAGDLNQDAGEGGIIENCIADAQCRTREWQLGGITGVINAGIIQNTLYSGILDANRSTLVCGVVGLLDSDNNPSEISNTLTAAAHMNARQSGTSERLIGLAGRNMTLSNNYITKSTLFDGGRSSDFGDADSAEGAQVDDAEAKTKDFYVNTLGWDFDNVWTFLEGTEGKAYPVLKWMKAPLPTSIFDMPDDVTLIYEMGYEYESMDKVHGSWGQPLNFTIVEGAEYAEYDPNDNSIYAGINGYYNGEGTVKVKVSIDAAIADKYSVKGDDTFSMFITENSGTKEIATAQDFINIARNLTADYVLTADIDMTDVAFGGIAIGKEFTGTLDGQGHKVTGLKVNGNGGTDFGIFGKTVGATIKNIAFEDFQVNNPSANHVGFVGYAQSTTFEEVALNGKVWGNDHVAILAGDGDNVTVNNCMLYGYVYAYSQVGGFFGCTLDAGATVTNSYYNGELNAFMRGWVGGVVGLIDKGGATITIENCVSIGDCHSFGDGSPHVTAPFIGGNRAGGDEPSDWSIINFHNNIYNATAVMDGDTDWPYNRLTADGGDVEAATGVSAESLKQESTYTGLGWDFTNVWQMGTGDYPYPVLKNAKMNNPELGIQEVGAAQDIVRSTKTFNIMGQQVNESNAKGIIIRNGKKFILK